MKLREGNEDADYVPATLTSDRDVALWHSLARLFEPYTANTVEDDLDASKQSFAGVLRLMADELSPEQKADACENR